MWALVVVVLLLCSFPPLASARRSIARDKYLHADKAEYVKRMEVLSALPATQPQQILTSLSGQPNTVTVTWVTMADTNSTTVQWGTSSVLSSSNNGSSFHFVDLEPAHTLRIIHTAHLTDLKPGVTVNYRVGDALSNMWSELLNFTLPTAGAEVVSMIVYGDLGLVNSNSVQNIIQEVTNGTASLVLHDGQTITPSPHTSTPLALTSSAVCHFTRCLSLYGCITVQVTMPMI